MSCNLAVARFLPNIIRQQPISMQPLTNPGSFNSFVIDSEPERETARKRERRIRRNARKQTDAIKLDQPLAPSKIGFEAPSQGGANSPNSTSRTQPQECGSDPTIGSDDSPPSLGILHYAYTDPQSNKRSDATSRVLFRKVKASTAGTSDPPLFLSPAEVSQLDHCISCNTPWTIRKTPLQKFYHIQKCTNKHKITLENTRNLIAKATSARTTVTSVQGPESAKSLLGHILADNKPIAKRRKVVKSATLLETGQAQSVLQDKARLTLTIDVDDDFVELPPATQTFATSKLAERFKPSSNIINAERMLAGEGSSPVLQAKRSLVTLAGSNRLPPCDEVRC